MNNTERPTPSTDFTVNTVQSFNSKVIHIAEHGNRPGNVWSACNGRSVSMGFQGVADVTEVTCKRCIKKVTA